MGADFVHIHVHSHYSLQDAAATVGELVKAAKEDGMTALALTDHGVMYGIAEFYKKAKEAGIKPIIGSELYIVPDKASRFDKGKNERSDDDNDTYSSSPKKIYNHLILLAKNEIGYKNLVKLCSIGHKEGYYYKPRIDWETLVQYHEGLICTTACPAGIIATPIINNEYEKAKQIALEYKELFGDDFYLEIQDHGLEIEKKLLKYIPQIAKETGIKLVATNDVHYQKREHAIAHNILINLSEKDIDYRNLRYGTDQLYFKTADEMKAIFKDFPEAIESTLEIADKINLEFKFGVYHMPKFPIPEEHKEKNLDQYFIYLAKEGLKRRFANITPEIRERFDFEIETIVKMGFSGYFLIVQDFINASKQRGIAVGPGRGSAAGSLVAYCLGITNVDPLEYDLLFERFLNPDRKSMPDIDVDFADDKREKVIEYVKEKYGEESVSQIVTFNTLSSKAVLTDVARVIGVPLNEVKNITKHIPSVFGKVYSIEQAINEVPELEHLKNPQNEKIKELLEYSKILEGKNRNSSKHAAGVVIAPGDITDYVPIAKAQREDNVFVTQFNMKMLEDFAGLLKMDFLGLRTLTIITETIKLIKKNYGIEIDLDKIPFDDPKTYELFSNGQTTAVFQFESPNMREYLSRLKPESIKDLAAMNALYRPGPMQFIDTFIKKKFGQEEITYRHPKLEPILKETYGIIVYQEQAIQIANKIAGMTLAQADILRRAMGKKDAEAMKKQKSIFVEGAVKNGIDEQIATDIFNDIEAFASYGFNKSHAVAYSVVAYYTAYLKANYPAEFLAANMTNELNDVSKIAILLDECRKMKINVRPPNINKPSVYFDVENGEIIFGMAAIKGVGEGAVEEIYNAKKNLNRDFKNIFDFCANVDNRILNKKALEALVLAGAFDFTGFSRSQNFMAIEAAIEYGKNYKKTLEKSTDSLFDLSASDDILIQEPKMPEVPSWGLEIELANERKVLGFYLSDHPVSNYEIDRNFIANVELGDTTNVNDNDEVTVLGVIIEKDEKLDKNKRPMAFFKVDDITGVCECIIFNRAYESAKNLLVEENVVCINGIAENTGDSIKITVNKVMDVESARNQTVKALNLIIDEKNTVDDLNKIQNILEKYPGNKNVIITYYKNKMLRHFNLNIKINLSNDLLNELLQILSRNKIKYYK
ncbi:MAG TPA: DNA polymerase III subunit alpha [Ignavibacteriales bacterium]|nr:DNA polymerase III subunit alpha [Ignavibacteriales bacterium]